MPQDRGLALSRRAAIAFGGAGLLSTAPLARSFGQDGFVSPRVVVGFAAGGPTDVIARLVVEQLRSSYASSLIVENKVGAAGRLAIDTVKRAPADGSVFLLTPGSLLTIYPHVYKKLEYDAAQDLMPVTTVAVTGYALSVGPVVPSSVRTLAAFVEWCKANPGKAAYASPAAGSTPHFVGANFARAAGINIQHVGYRGSSPAMQDLLGGQIAAASTLLFDTLAHLKEGTLRVLATSGTKRSPLLPEIQTFIEQGFAGFDAQEWIGFFLPRGATVDVVNKLAAAINKAANDPTIQQRLREFGFEPSAIASSALADLIALETAKWAPIVQQTGFSIE